MCPGMQRLTDRNRGDLWRSATWPLRPLRRPGLACSLTSPPQRAAVEVATERRSADAHAAATAIQAHRAPPRSFMLASMPCLHTHPCAGERSTCDSSASRVRARAACRRRRPHLPNLFTALVAVACFAHLSAPEGSTPSRSRRALTSLRAAKAWSARCSWGSRPHQRSRGAETLEFMQHPNHPFFSLSWSTAA